VCDKFEADHVGMNCTRCEHDYGCHTEARSNAEVTGCRRQSGAPNSSTARKDR
jgi:hypothetical protein